MNKSLLLLVPLVAFADSTVTKETKPVYMDWATRLNTLKNIPKTYAEFRAFYPISSEDRKYPVDFTSKERIKIDKLSRQVRLYDRGVMLYPTCSPSRSKAKVRRDKAYKELKTVEPTTDKYYKMKYYRYNIREDWQTSSRR
jgi:hypothetical protein